MKRTWAVVGAAALAVVGAAAVAQAQAPGTNGPQGRPGARMEQRMDQRGPQGQGPQRGMGQPGMQRGRGPGGPGGQAGPGRPGGPGRRGGPGFGLRGLDLTDDQKTQLQAIHEQTRQAIDNILTPEQKARRRGGR